VRTSVVIVCKDDPSLAGTLDALGPPGAGTPQDEVVVVDASRRKLDWARQSHPWARWVDYEPPPGRSVTIAHQRNLGVRTATGDVIAFTDAGCFPDAGWLERLLAPLARDGEAMSAGPVRADRPSIYSGAPGTSSERPRYVDAAPTINLAFRRRVFDGLGGFDESFGAGEDLDFTWRAVDAGYRIRWVHDAGVRHEWGGTGRQLRRSVFYGKGWGRLLRKHPRRVLGALRSAPVAVVYPLYLLGLPLALRRKSYLALLAVPLWRARHEQRPWLVVADHLALGAGVLWELAGPGAARSGTGQGIPNAGKKARRGSRAEP
jgi:GT2 family glycosyltransferase